MRCKYLVYFIVFFIFLYPCLADLVVIDLVENTEYIDGYIQSTTYGSLDSASINIGFFGGLVYRGYFDFNTTIIPDTSTIVSVELNLTVKTQADNNLDVYSLNGTAAIMSGRQSLYDQIAGINSTLLVSNTAVWNLVANNHASLNLTAIAATILQNQLSEDYFSVGVKYNNEGVIWGRHMYFVAVQRLATGHSGVSHDDRRFWPVD